ncbi:MAG: OmpA family protein [Candidatus Binatia bacterium]
MGSPLFMKKSFFIVLGSVFIMSGVQGCVATRDWVAEKLAPLTGRVDKVEGRVTNVEGNVAKVDGRVSEVDGRVKKLGTRLTGAEHRLGDTEGKADQALARLANLRLERKLVLHLKEGANFGFNSYALSKDVKRQIDGFLSDLKSDLKGGGQTVFLVAGHTDSTGSAEYNYELGRKRAEQVARHLIIDSKIDPTKIMTVSYGESAPVGNNRTRTGRRKNRRIEILVYNAKINTSPQVSSVR